MKTPIVRVLKTLLKQQGRRRSGTFEEGNRRLRSIHCRMSSPCFKDEEGQSLVEFALVAPILIAVLMGIFEFGIAFYNQLQLTQAVGQGALYLQQQDPANSGITDPCASAFTYIKNSAPSLNPNNITLTVTMGSNPPITGSSCSSDISEFAAEEPVTIQATYPCNITLFAVNLDHISAWNFNCTLSAQVTEYQY